MASKVLYAIHFVTTRLKLDTEAGLYIELDHVTMNYKEGSYIILLCKETVGRIVYYQVFSIKDES